VSYYTGGDYFMAGDYYRGGGFFKKLRKAVGKVATFATKNPIGQLALGAIGGGVAIPLLGALAGSGGGSGHTGVPGTSLPMPGTAHHAARRQMRRAPRGRYKRGRY